VGEAKRKQLAGNTEPSNPKWKRTRKFTRKDERELTAKIMNRMGIRLPRY
jgi:hypothetical protein